MVETGDPAVRAAIDAKLQALQAAQARMQAVIYGD
jgi:hypothetical protein